MTTPVPTSWNYEPVPSSAVHLFRLAWQLETWLRSMVYVELRAARVDWEEPIKEAVNGWPPSSLKSDKRLHHMATPHQAALSYLTFGQLWEIISNDAVWPLFEPYFPPKHLAEGRVEEIKAIRNRVAHFREPHAQDRARLELFLRDMEPGLRAFCNRYSVGKLATKPEHDPVSDFLMASWGQAGFGYGTELNRPSGGWIYAHPHRSDPKLHARLELLTHRNYQLGSLEGVIYRLRMDSGVERFMDGRRFLDSTTGLHRDVIHLFPSNHAISVTIPAIQGAEATAELIGKFLSVGVDSTTDEQKSDDMGDWPEYVVRHDQMLAFYDADMKESVLDLAEPKRDGHEG